MPLRAVIRPAGISGENYAVQINRKKYNVFYDGFASNVMPEITIIPIDE